VLRFQLGDLIP